jgi:hypothetical protein
MANYQAARALMGKGRNAGEGAAFKEQRQEVRGEKWSEGDEYAVPGSRRMDCIGRVVTRPSDREHRESTRAAQAEAQKEVTLATAFSEREGFARSTCARHARKKDWACIDSSDSWLRIIVV